MDLEHPLAWWLANDIVLDFGQRGIINDLGWYKVGDGNNPFSGLQLLGLNSINVWFSFWGPQKNKGNALTTLFHSTLIGGSLVQEGGWAEFEYTVMPTLNVNAKNIYIKLSNQTIFNLPLLVNSSAPVIICGSIQVTDYTNGKAIAKIWSIRNSAIAFLQIIELSGINWNANNILIIQAQGVDNNDITCNGGTGKICIVSRF